jgi:hypothetical protein
MSNSKRSKCSKIYKIGDRIRIGNSEYTYGSEECERALGNRQKYVERWRENKKKEKDNNNQLFDDVKKENAKLREDLLKIYKEMKDQAKNHNQIPNDLLKKMNDIESKVASYLPEAETLTNNESCKDQIFSSNISNLTSMLDSRKLYDQIDFLT